MRIRLLTLIACLCALTMVHSHLTAQVSITNQTSFHKASFGTTYGALEGGTIDNGGLTTLFVRNNGLVTDSLLEVKISKANVYDTLNYAVWWPLEMAPGGTTSVLLKGLAVPFAEGDTVLLEVITSNSFYAQQTFVNETPGLRIGNLMPSHDMSVLWVYLRNDEASNVVFSSIDFNDNTLLPGNPALQLLGGNTTIKPGDVAILKIQASTVPLTPLMSVRLNVRYQLGNSSKNVSSFQRLVPAEFPLGTWHSPTANTNEEETRKLLRRLSITSVFGPFNISNINDNLPEYFYKVVREADFYHNNAFDPANANTAQYLAQNSSNAQIHYWNVDDEPDLKNKLIAEGISKNKLYWAKDANTPSYINLASQKNFQRYGFYTDVVSMDHYSDDGPPNVIPFPYWYTVEGSVREAIEYTAQLKKNTEPKRLNSWSQLLAGVFSNQAEPFVINFQFWAHVMEGAKGIHFFTAKPNQVEDFPAQWGESEKLVHQLNGVKNLCLYGEPWDGITVNSGNVIAKSLAGPDALTIVLLNNTIDYTSVNVINRIWTAAISAEPFDIQFTVPDWIPLDKFYETDENNRFDITSITNISGRTYRITGTINERSKVFVIGKNDTEPPQQITDINVADKPSPSDFTLSWSEPIDNFGVKGYYIKADNDIIDSVQAPIWESNDKVNACFIGYWSVMPYDDAHNMGQPSVLTIDWSGVGSGNPVVSQHPAAQSISAGTNAAFTVAVSGISGTAYLWQVDTGNGIWSNLQNSNEYHGVYTYSLSVYGLPAFNNYQYRCVVSAGCSQNRDTSDVAILTVIGVLSVEDLLEAKVKVFPNPSNGEFTVRNNSSETLLLTITDNLGRKIQSQVSINASSDVPISGLLPGVYQVALQNDQVHTVTKRIIVL